MIKRVDHIAVVVDDIEAALSFWRDALGLDLSHVEDVPDEESAVAFLTVGEGELELVKPTSEHSGIARYLLKRGPSMHHICFEVEHIAATLDRLRARGIRLIDEQPKIGTGGKKVAFIHPESTHGVLVELYELTPQEPHRRLERARGLADRALAEGQVMRAAVLGFLGAIVSRDGKNERGERRNIILDDSRNE